MAEERGLKVDTDKFDELMDEQRKRAQAAQKSTLPKFMMAGVELPDTDDAGKYETDTCTTKVTGLTDFIDYYTEGTFDSDVVLRPDNKGNILVGTEETIAVILEKTCFYAEAGGQVGDCGKIESATGEVIVIETERLGNCVVHKGRLVRGTISIGDEVVVKVDRNRTETKKNHTATHLLQWALQQVKGRSVSQQGSLVGPDYLRFDFTCPKALSNKEVGKVEQLVRERIAADEPVTCAVMPRAEAEKLGAMALFGEKYGSDVRVVAIGAEAEEKVGSAFSKEFCGGTHVDRLGAIGGFKIIKEESIAAGVRRITALTGAGLSKYLEERSSIVDGLSEMLKVPADEVIERVERLIKENKKLAKELKAGGASRGADTMAGAKKLLEQAEKVGQSHIITGSLSAASDEQARAAIDMLRKKAKSAAVILGFVDGKKATLVAGVTDDLVKRGVSAGDVIKTIAPLIDGGGGGRPQMAQAGGKNPDKIDEALAEAAEVIKKKLTAS
jgi:alanyl-tRNA synthetase